MLYQNVELHNVVELIPSDKGEGFHMLRVPSQLRATLNEAARGCAVYPSGVEVRFNLAPGQKAKIVLAAEGGEVVPTAAECYQGCYRMWAKVVKQEPTTLTIEHGANQAKLERISRDYNLPFDSRLTRVLVPPTVPVRLISIEGDMTPPQPGQTPSRRYLAYGSSITHGANACRPSGIYAMLTARHLGADLIAQGYGGGAHLEETMAQYLAGRDDWDFASLEMGINIGGLKADEFRRKVEKFVGIIASAHPDKWIFCIDVFPFWPDLGEPADHCVGFREAVAAAVKALHRPHLVHVDGREILRDPAGLSNDLVHPTDDGFAEMALNLSGLMRRTMQPA